MRRATWLGGAWVLAPLVVGLAYAAVHPLVRGRPSLRDLVPKETIETQRFRDLAVFDALKTPPGGVRASALLGAALNLPGLPGIDPSRPLLGVTIAPELGHDSEMFVLPVRDADAVRRSFDDPDLVERHAAHLEIHGDLAVVGRDRAAVRRASPSGDLWPEELGEDWARVADWPRLVAHAIDRRGEEPMRGALEAIGVDVERMVAGPAATSRGEVSFGRLPRVREAWATVALHGWPGRVRATLVPTAGGELAKAMAEATTRAPGDVRLAPPPYVDGARLVVHGESSRRVLALALRDAGVSFPPRVDVSSFESGSLTLWVEQTAEGWWTVVLAGAMLPDLAAFDLEGPDARPAAITAPYGGPVPPPAFARADAAAARVKVAAFGPNAAGAAERAAPALGAAAPVPPVGAGETLLADFHLPAEAAKRLLGRAILAGGLLPGLDGGAIDGVLSTDGRRLVLELRTK